MYRMMIVDDEDQERFGIQYLLKDRDWNFSILLKMEWKRWKN